MRPNVNTQTALTLPGPIPLQKGVGPGDEAKCKHANLPGPIPLQKGVGPGNEASHEVDVLLFLFHSLDVLVQRGERFWVVGGLES